ncbi:cob(I)yrinic acid a,c-diamide adenosyltransferase [Aminivibrio sp.]|jgi:cob(I)alamin adenosyltransferase|uniref:cob(I)yrinic acid a,c-diamide adenosyltransferase n=1 Tax=Aminivibrio sp. TaxID=1872489 RepID=UPI001A5CD076|nr:cob(I)yrinic acid a,c-diamide adenosyltransferase [Aminivibrio sp.]MBL3539806.1 cob(I)yrinic acid a,c-diamide adenosyltransferase [Aminivibrio sp.]MDK2958017.1 cob(I)alamin adenosyltransferase [Synergistaceae bacterium]
MDYQGYVHVYTGNGKGKTTAALGLLLRASGAGMTVFLGQFLKRGVYSEHAALALLPGVTVETFGGERGVGTPPTEQDSVLARRGLERLRDVVSSGNWGAVIADEIFVAVHLGLLAETDVLYLLEVRHTSTELVLTGRYAFPKILERADLVTEMKELRHYFSRGVPARKGIEK